MNIPSPKNYQGPKSEYFTPTVVDGKLKCCQAKNSCKCGYSFKHNRAGLDVLACPECGHDRRCWCNVSNSPNGRCRKHGGKQPRGTNHKSWKHGRDSIAAKSVPEEYYNRFVANLNDPNLLDNTEQIALMAARWQEQTESLSSGENKFSVQALQELWSIMQLSNEAFERARESGDAKAAVKAQQRFAKTMAAIGELIGAAADKFQAWEDWKETTKDLSALRIDQAKMRDFQARYMAAEMVIAIAIAIRDAVMRVLTPREHGRELQLIVDELDRVMGNGVMLIPGPKEEAE